MSERTLNELPIVLSCVLNFVPVGVRSREMFNKWEAQRWWGENYDRIVELYNVLTFSGRQQGCSTPVSSVDDSVLVGTRKHPSQRSSVADQT